MDQETFTHIMDKIRALILKIDPPQEIGVFEVVICGSSRFCDLISVLKWELEKKGIIATGLHFLPDWYTKHANWEENHHGAEQENVADVLDEIHLRKIDSCDAVIVCNWDNYIGDRTSIEIDYTKEKKIPIYYLIDQE